MKTSFEGKVREMCDLGDTLMIVTSDRVSAFDVVLPTSIPHKGQILNQMSAFWFDYTKRICRNHLITADNSIMIEEFRGPQFDGRCMLVKKLKMLPIECIVRGYITGSGWSSYQENGTVCGIKLPDGLQESEKLGTPIYTPTTKAKNGHDQHITYEQTIDLIGEEYAAELRELSIELYEAGARYAREKGIIIADTKFEFGIDKAGNVVLADEMLTPDSSRFWSLSDYEVGKSQPSFDKQYLRDWLKNDSGWDMESDAPNLPQYVVDVTIGKYEEAYNRLIGQRLPY